MTTLLKHLGYTAIGIAIGFYLIAMLAAVLNFNQIGGQLALTYFPFGVSFSVIGIGGLWASRRRSIKFNLRESGARQEHVQLVAQTKIEEKASENITAHVQRETKVERYAEAEPKRTSDSHENQVSTNSPSNVGASVSALALVISALGAIAVWSYRENFSLGYGVSIPLYPYRPYVAIFAIAAFVSLGGLLYSLAVSSRTQAARTVSFQREYAQEETGASQIRCGTCGTMNDLDAVFCKKCARQFKG